MADKLITPVKLLALVFSLLTISPARAALDTQVKYDATDGVVPEQLGSVRSDDDSDPAILLPSEKADAGAPTGVQLNSEPTESKSTEDEAKPDRTGEMLPPTIVRFHPTRGVGPKLQVRHRCNHGRRWFDRRGPMLRGRLGFRSYDDYMILKQEVGGSKTEKGGLEPSGDPFLRRWAMMRGQQPRLGQADLKRHGGRKMPRHQMQRISR